MEILLTIAIATVPARKQVFDELMIELERQIKPYGKSIEIISLTDNMEISIGAKRNQLNQMAKGKYVVHWDDDDWICEGGIDMIMKGIESDCDVISYNIWCDVEEWMHRRYWHRWCSIKYGPVRQEWDNNQDILLITPDQKQVIKKEILDKVPFVDIRYREDVFFANDIFPYLKTEHYINEYIYHYVNRSGEDTFDLRKRYGIKRANSLL